jgi:hypothetical protein
MRKHIELKRFNQGTALTTGTLALPPLVMRDLRSSTAASSDCVLRLGLRPLRRCLRLMRNSFVASATNGTRTGRAIDGA